MSYNYQEERPNIFTEEGQVTFMKVRDFVKNAIESHGAVRMDKAMSIAGSGSSWTQCAMIDRLVELGEIIEISPPDSCWGQYRVFSDKVHNR